MVTQTFEAQVVHGQLVPAEVLRPFEGQQVQVTVTPAPVPAADSQPKGEPDPPDDLDVEKDVYVPMPLRSEVIPNAVIKDGAPLEPCTFIPEDLPDE